MLRPPIHDTYRAPVLITCLPTCRPSTTRLLFVNSQHVTCHLGPSFPCSPPCNARAVPECSQGFVKTGFGFIYLGWGVCSLVLWFVHLPFLAFSIDYLLGSRRQVLTRVNFRKMESNCASTSTYSKQCYGMDTLGRFM